MWDGGWQVRKRIQGQWAYRLTDRGGSPSEREKFAVRMPRRMSCTSVRNTYDEGRRGAWIRAL